MQATMTRFRVRSPALAILIIAPFCGETLSGATPPLDLILPWNLALLAGLYGCGALICREVVRRWQLGLPGLCLLGAAYGVYEEALVDRYWFYPKFWHDAGVGTYSEVWHTNLLLATHLTAFHLVVSMCSSVLIVERLFPSARDQPWAGRPGLTLAVISLGLIVPLLYGDQPAGPIGAMLVAGGLVVLLVIAAFLTPRVRAAAAATSVRRRGVGLIAFACTAAHFLLVYSIPSTGLMWPLGVPISLLPIVLGVVLLRHRVTGGRYGDDALRVITGIVLFFVLLDAAVGLGGRYDLTVGAVATLCALRWLRKRNQPDGTLRPCADTT